MNSTQNISKLEGFCIDASAWIEYLRGTPKGKKIADTIAKKNVYVSTMTVYEVAAVLGREGNDVESVVRNVLARAITIHVSSEIAGNAAQFYKVARVKKPKISGGDAIAFVTADDFGLPLITCDNDFQGIKNAIVIR
jgi:uncharacterized protein with PIN domain